VLPFPNLFFRQKAKNDCDAIIILVGFFSKHNAAAAVANDGGPSRVSQNARRSSLSHTILPAAALIVTFKHAVEFPEFENAEQMRCVQSAESQQHVA